MKLRHHVLSGAVAAAALVATTLSAGQIRPVNQRLGPSADICDSDRTSDARAISAKADRYYTVSVPRDEIMTDIPARPTYQVSKNAVIQVRVKTPVAGNVGIHGVLDFHRVTPENDTCVRFRAKYSGRFPLHFHGDAGAHIELIVFEVSD